jgi:DNA-binding NtrC family response regulator
LDQIQKSHPDLPIILMTGWPNLSAPAAQRGIGHLMEKPLDLPVLLELIQRLVAEPPQPARQRASEASAGQTLAAGLSLTAAARR